MVVPIGRDSNGTDFLCLCCRKEFRLPKMAFYEEKTNSLMTGWCFMGLHTTTTGIKHLNWRPLCDSQRLIDKTFSPQVSVKIAFILKVPNKMMVSLHSKNILR